MSETFLDFLRFLRKERYLVLVLVTFIIILFGIVSGEVKITIRDTETQPINSYDMGNGVTCYTSNTSMYCLQAEK